MKAFSKIFLAAGAAVALSATLALAADTTPRNAANDAYGCPGAAYSGQMGRGMMGAGYGRMGYGHMSADRMGNGRGGMMRDVSATGADNISMGPRATQMSGGAGRTL